MALVVLAAGSSRRAETETNKVLLPLAGRRVVTWTLDSTAQLPGLAVTVIVCRDEDRPVMQRVLDRESPHRPVEFATGGDTRHGSEYSALGVLRDRIRAGTIDTVVIHDSARPLAAPRLFHDVISAAREHGGAIPALPLPTLVTLAGAQPGGDLVGVQTPQAFRAQPLLAAYDQAHEVGFDGTDTAACFERFGNGRVRAISGDPRNVKITFPEDLFVAERILAHSGWTLED